MSPMLFEMYYVFPPVVCNLTRPYLKFDLKYYHTTAIEAFLISLNIQFM